MAQFEAAGLKESRLDATIILVDIEKLMCSRDMELIETVERLAA